MQRFLRWTVPIAIAIMFLGAFSRPANLAAANAVSGDHNVATINNVGSAADQLIALNTDSNLNPNQMVLLRSYGHDGQTQQAIAMDNDGCGTQVASTTTGFDFGHSWAAMMATHRRDNGHQQIAYFGNGSGLQHLQANTGATFNDTGPQYALGIATTSNSPGRQYMAATNETWTDGHLAWRDAYKGGQSGGFHRLAKALQAQVNQFFAMQTPMAMGHLRL